MGRAYNVVDADGHILEPLDLWDKYIDPKFRDRAPRIVKGENGKERLVIEEHAVGDGQRGIGRIGAVGARQGVVDDTMEYKDGKPGGFDPHKRIPDMDADGIDAAFLYPSLGLFSGAIQDPELAAATCRAYNRWLADYCKPYPDRLFGIAMLPMQSVDLAIAEMRFARKELGFRGGFIRPNPYRQQDDPRRADVRAVLGRGRGSRFLDRLPRRRLERHADGRRRPLRGPRRPPHHLAYDGDDAGLPERDLGRRLRTPPEDPHRLSRIGRRLDRAVARPHGPAFRRPGLQRFRSDDAPERAVPAQLLDLVRAGRGQLKALADYIGPHKIMWATDYPHPDGFFPGAPKMIMERMEGLSPETKHQVMAGGAMGFYGLN